MPDRVIRDELLESEKWLSLKDNADRLAFIALLLKADSLGNFSAEPFRLMRLWRDFGINTVALVAKTLTELSDHDLVRQYQVGDKLLLHLPRFGQRLRHLTRVFPLSPWTTEEQKQALMNKSPDSRQSQDSLGSVEEKGSEELPLPATRKKRASPGSKGNGESKSGATWQAYSTAYFTRYHVNPVRNKQVNSMLAKLVDRLGEQDAPHVAGYYLTHDRAFYVGSKHSVNLLLANAEGLRTEWATGQHTTETVARQADKGQAQKHVWTKLQAEIKP